MKPVEWLAAPCRGDLHVAAIHLPAMCEGAATHVFTLNAREHSWDFKTADGLVLDYGGAHNLADAQSRARDALFRAAQNLMAISYARGE